MSSASSVPILINGVSVRLIDKLPQPHDAQRGAGIHPRTLEVYNILGVLPDVLAKALPLRPLNSYKLPGGVEVISTVYLVPQEEPTPSTPYINAMILGQAKVEAILRKHLAEYGCHIEFGTKLLTFEQHADRVVAQVAKVSDGRETSETVTCHWLVGTDGARGVVRKQLGLTFLGESRPEQVFFGEIEVQGLDEEVFSFIFRAQLLTDMDISSAGIPGANSAREYDVTLRPTEDKGLFQFIIGGDVDYEKIISEDMGLAQTIKDISNWNDLVFGEVKSKTDYRPKMRMADRFSEGRVFIAGDAAHTHSPTGGQGLNSSVQDVFNLGWKLALVEKGVACPSLLSTYTNERVPVIAHMLGVTTKLYKATYGATGGTTGGQQTWSRTREIKQLDIHYRWSPIVVDERDPPGTPRQPEDVYGANVTDGPRAGDRAPDVPGLVPTKANGPDRELISLFRVFDPSHHTVLVFSDSDELIASVHDLLRTYPAGLARSVLIRAQDTAPAHDDRVDLVVLDRDSYAYGGYRVAESGIKVVVIRPDGVIGGMLIGSVGLRRYLGGVFSTTAS